MLNEVIPENSVKLTPCSDNFGYKAKILKKILSIMARSPRVCSRESKGNVS
jgi:hypothetical protein